MVLAARLRGRTAALTPHLLIVGESDAATEGLHEVCSGWPPQTIKRIEKNKYGPAHRRNHHAARFGRHTSPEGVTTEWLRFRCEGEAPLCPRVGIAGDAPALIPLTRQQPHATRAARSGASPCLTCSRRSRPHRTGSRQRRPSGDWSNSGQIRSARQPTTGIIRVLLRQFGSPIVLLLIAAGRRHQRRTSPAHGGREHFGAASLRRREGGR